MGRDGIHAWLAAGFFAGVGFLQLPLLALRQVTPQEVPGNLGFMLLIAAPFVLLAWVLQGFVVRRREPAPSRRPVLPAQRVQDGHPAQRVRDSPARPVIARAEDVAGRESR